MAMNTFLISVELINTGEHGFDFTAKATGGKWKDI